MLKPGPGAGEMLQLLSFRVAQVPINRNRCLTDQSPCPASQRWPLRWAGGDTLRGARPCWPPLWWPLSADSCMLSRSVRLVPAHQLSLQRKDSAIECQGGVRPPPRSSVCAGLALGKGRGEEAVLTSALSPRPRPGLPGGQDMGQSWPMTARFGKLTTSSSSDSLPGLLRALRTGRDRDPVAGRVSRLQRERER